MQSYVNNIVNLFEYVIKKQSDLLNQNVHVIYSRLKYLENEKNSKKLDVKEVSNLGNVKFLIDNKEIKEDDVKKFDNLPEYNGESIAEFKEKIRKVN